MRTNNFPQAKGREDTQFAAFLRNVEPQMKRWRNEEIGLPRTYIDGHKTFATNDLSRLETEGWKVWGFELVHDGWMDGMMFIAAAVEDPVTHRIIKIKWADNGLWYEESEYGGWVLL